MAKKVTTIGVLTSGGDAPGMNAAIRAVVRAGISSGLKVKGVRRGYAGLLEEDIIDMDTMSVTDIVQRGGTILFTSRCKEMMTPEGQQKAADICRKHGIDGMVVIGGDGSFRGAQKLSANGINTIVSREPLTWILPVPNTRLDLILPATRAMEAIDKVRDTSASHERCSIIEVMGRTAGHIALWCGISNGSEYVLIPERAEENDEEEIIRKIISKRRIGKKHHIIVNAEGVGHSHEMAKRIEAATGIETRATVIGHIQRGGNPSCRDRVYASAMGARAVDLLLKGQTNRVVAYKNGEFTDFDIDYALQMTKDIDEHLYSMTKRLSR